MATNRTVRIHIFAKKEKMKYKAKSHIDINSHTTRKMSDCALYVINVPAGHKPSRYIINALDTNHFKRRRVENPQHEHGCTITFDSSGCVGSVTFDSNMLDACRGNSPKDMYSFVIKPKLNVH